MKASLSPELLGICSSFCLFPLYVKFEFSLLIFVCIVWYTCSYNSDKLASACHILFSSRGSKNEILWAQTFWAEICNGIWDS